MATKDKIVNLEDLKVVGDEVSSLKSRVTTLEDDSYIIVNRLVETKDTHLFRIGGANNYGVNLQNITNRLWSTNGGAYETSSGPDLFYADSPIYVQINSDDVSAYVYTFNHSGEVGTESGWITKSNP